VQSFRCTSLNNMAVEEEVFDKIELDKEFLGTGPYSYADFKRHQHERLFNSSSSSDKGAAMMVNHDSIGCISLEAGDLLSSKHDMLRYKQARYPSQFKDDTTDPAKNENSKTADGKWDVSGTFEYFHDNDEAKDMSRLPKVDHYANEKAPTDDSLSSLTGFDIHFLARNFNNEEANEKSKSSMGDSLSTLTFLERKDASSSALEDSFGNSLTTLAWKELTLSKARRGNIIPVMQDSMSAIDTSQFQGLVEALKTKNKEESSKDEADSPPPLAKQETEATLLAENKETKNTNKEKEGSQEDGEASLDNSMFQCANGVNGHAYTAQESKPRRVSSEMLSVDRSFHSAVDKRYETYCRIKKNKGTQRSHSLHAPSSHQTEKNTENPNPTSISHRQNVEPGRPSSTMKNVTKKGWSKKKTFNSSTSGSTIKIRHNRARISSSADATNDTPIDNGASSKPRSTSPKKIEYYERRVSSILYGDMEDF